MTCHQTCNETDNQTNTRTSHAKTQQIIYQINKAKLNYYKSLWWRAAYSAETVPSENDFYHCADKKM